MSERSVGSSVLKWPASSSSRVSWYVFYDLPTLWLRSRATADPLE